MIELVERLKKVNWEEAEKLFFDNLREFERWRFREKEVEILYSVSSDKDEVVRYHMMVKGKPKIAVVRLTVDDFYIDEVIAEGILTEDYVLEKSEGKDFAMPALVCKELYNLLYRMIYVASYSGALARVSPEEAEKLIKMAEYVEEASKLLKKFVIRGIRYYVSLVALGLVKDEEWEKLIKKMEEKKDDSRKDS